MNKDEIRNLVGQKANRTAAIEVRAAEDGTVELSFSSELPVERWYGPEILVHDSASANFSRLKEVGAILLNHDPRQIVGRPEKIWLDEKEPLSQVLTCGVALTVRPRSRARVVIACLCMIAPSVGRIPLPLLCRSR